MGIIEKWDDPFFGWILLGKKLKILLMLFLKQLYEEHHDINEGTQSLIQTKELPSITIKIYNMSTTVHSKQCYINMW